MSVAVNKLLLFHLLESNNDGIAPKLCNSSGILLWLVLVHRAQSIHQALVACATDGWIAVRWHAGSSLLIAAKEVGNDLAIALSFIDNLEFVVAGTDTRISDVAPASRPIVASVDFIGLRESCFELNIPSFVDVWNGIVIVIDGFINNFYPTATAAAFSDGFKLISGSFLMLIRSGRRGCGVVIDEIFGRISLGDREGRQAFSCHQ